MKKWLWAALGFVAIAGLAATFAFRRWTSTWLHGVAAAVPESSFAVLTIDADSLRKSPLGDRVFGQLRPRLTGVTVVSETCGIDTLSHIRELAVVAPEEGPTGTFGLLAMPDLGLLEMKSCADKLLGTLGNKVKVTDQGDFKVLEGAGAFSDPTLAKMAYAPGTPLLFGEGPWFDRILATASGKSPSMAGTGEHGSLRKAVEPPGKHGTVVLTAVFPAELRHRLRDEQKPESEAEEKAMGAVLNIRSAGLAVTVGSSKTALTTATAELRCEAEGPCKEVERLILRRRLSWSQDIKLRLFGLGPLIDSLSAQTRGTTVTVTAQIGTEPLVEMFDQAVRLFGSFSQISSVVRSASAASNAASNAASPAGSSAPPISGEPSSASPQPQGSPSATPSSPSEAGMAPSASPKNQSPPRPQKKSP
jgi:hypothetical protein